MKKIILIPIILLFIFSAIFLVWTMKEKAGFLISGNKTEVSIEEALPVPGEELYGEVMEKVTFMSGAVIEVLEKEEKPVVAEIPEKIPEKTVAPQVKKAVKNPADETIPVFADMPVEQAEPASDLQTKKAVEDPVVEINAMPAVAIAEKREPLAAIKTLEMPEQDLFPAPVAILSGLALVVSSNRILAAEPKGEVSPAPVEEKLTRVDNGDGLAILPFNNFSDDVSALAQVMPLLKNRIMDKGLVLLDDDSLSNLLCKEKVRSSGHISNDIARKVKNIFKVKYILAGSVISFFPGENLHVALMARLIDSSTGLIIWANYVSVSGDDFTGILGLGRIETMGQLIPRALDRLFSSFTTIPEQKDSESLHKIAVLPFLNKSKSRGAGTIVMYMLLVELIKNNKYQPIEYGEVRKFIVESRIRNKGALDYSKIEAFSRSLGIAGVIVGTVEQYSGGLKNSISPEVAISARLLDTRKNKILWYNSLQMNGEIKVIIFDWGKILPVDYVANNVVSELVNDMETATW